MKKWYIEDASCVVSQSAQTALTFTYYREPVGVRHVKYVAEFGSSIEDAKRLMQEATRRSPLDRRPRQRRHRPADLRSMRNQRVIKSEKTRRKLVSKTLDKSVSICYNTDVSRLEAKPSGGYRVR